MKIVSLILSAVVMTAMMLSSFGVGTSNEVTIGKQVWMSKNLNVDKFRNGDPIPQAKTDEEWKLAGINKQPAWCYYDNDSKNGTKYGKLYNWYAVNDMRGLAPVGFHIPTDDEWEILTDYLGGEENAGSKMKSKKGWRGDKNATNASGFSGLPGGYRFGATFLQIGRYGLWWSSSEYETIYAWCRGLDSYDEQIIKNQYTKGIGLSVRCLRD